MTTTTGTTGTGPDPDQSPGQTLETVPLGSPSDSDCRERLATVEDRWRRALADLDNLQKRFKRELARGQTAERERALGALLPTVDDLERALDHAGSGDDALLDGVRAITDAAIDTIAALGYPRFGEPGDRFDPQLHEVVSTTPAGPEAEANVVVAVVRSGYGAADRLLRAASVVVAKADD